MTLTKSLKIYDNKPFVAIMHLSPITLEKKLSREDFITLIKQFPDMQLEREKNGKVTIMPPVKFGSGKRELHIGYYLMKWWIENDEPGEAFGPSTGIELIDGSMKSPDAGWVSPKRMKQILPEEEEGEFLKVAPDFIVEIRSKTDSLAKLKRKMTNTWIKNGVRLAWLIDPYKEKSYIYRAGKEVEEVKGFDGKVLSGEEVVIDFELNLEKLKIKKRKK